MAKKGRNRQQNRRHQQVTLRETAPQQNLVATITSLQDDNRRLEESMAQVQSMLAKEDIGWLNLFSAGDEEWLGLRLIDLKEWSLEIRNAMIGNPHIKRGRSLRHSYIWQGGIHYGNVPAKKQGRGVNVQARIDDAINQRNYFGDEAHSRREGTAFSDGLTVYVGDEKTHRIYPLPLHEISATYHNPDYYPEIWAYRREWTSYTPGSSSPEFKSEWVFVDTFADQRVDIINYGGVDEKVSKTKVAFDMHANRQDGHAFGSPDALAALVWSRIARDLTMDGVTMSHALAQFAYQVSTATKDETSTVAARLASTTGAGGTSVGGNMLTPLNTAGKGYDFESFRPVVAVIAASLDVSVVALTSDPGAAGSSYGSASTLDLPTRLAMQARRAEWADLDRRVLAWLGAPDADVYFRALTDPTDLFRAQQGVGIKWDTGLYEPEEIKTQFEALEGNDTRNVTVPDGVMLPNNERFKDTLSNDGTTPPPAAGDGQKPTAPGQGKSTGRGKGPNANDIRNDTVTK